MSVQRQQTQLAAWQPLHQHAASADGGAQPERLQGPLTQALDNLAWAAEQTQPGGWACRDGRRIVFEYQTSVYGVTSHIQNDCAEEGRVAADLFHKNNELPKTKQATNTRKQNICQGFENNLQSEVSYYEPTLLGMMESVE